MQVSKKARKKLKQNYRMSEAYYTTILELSLEMSKIQRESLKIVREDLELGPEAQFSFNPETGEVVLD